MIYFEQRCLDRWMPCTMPKKPILKKGRILRGDGMMGPRVRGIVEVNIGHRNATLDQLRQTYSVDGAFTKGQGQ